MSKNILNVPHVETLTLSFIGKCLEDYGETMGKIPTEIHLSINNYVQFLYLLRDPETPPVFHGIKVKMRPRKGLLNI